MTKRNLPTLGSGTHVAFDIAGADLLLRFGAANVVRACSRLVAGPSRRNVSEHTQARLRWFHDTNRWEHLYSTEVRWETPIVVWVTSCLDDRLNRWRTCSWLYDKGIPRRDILIIDIPPRPPSPVAAPRTEPFECHDSAFYQSSKDAIQAHLAAARSWPRERYEQAVALWEQFVDQDPRLFARRCRRGVPGFPELGSIWAFFSRFFPRMSAERSLHLSRYDELLLRALSARWQTPMKMYIGETLQQHSEFFGCVGDLAMAHRLAAWAEHGARPAVDRAPGPRATENLMKASVYRLTKHGRQLQTALHGLTDAPRLPVGGAEVYAPEAPWVLRYDGRLVRL
jgi:hypothetical protein